MVQMYEPVPPQIILYILYFSLNIAISFNNLEFKKKI